MSLYVYFFNLSRNDVVENLLDLQRKHMIPLVQNKASIIQSVMQLPVNNLNQLVQMNLDIGQGRLSQQGADVQRKWDWNFYVVNENFSGFKKYMKRKNNMRWESTQNSSWSYTTSKLKYTDLTTSEKYSLSLSSASDIVMQPIYDVNPNQFASMYTVYSEGLTYSYPYNKDLNLEMNLLEQIFDCSKLDPSVYEPRCRPWYLNAFNAKNKIVFSQPYLDSELGSICLTLSKYFQISDKLEGVSAIDIDMQWGFYQKILDGFPGQDHYFILDMGFNLVYHSKSPIMLKISSITQVEFGVTRVQNNSTDDNIPDDDVITDESTYFNSTILPAFNLDTVSIMEFNNNGVGQLIAVCPIYLVLENDNSKQEHIFSIGIIMKTEDVTGPITSLSIISQKVIIIISLLAAFTIVMFVIAAIVAYETSHYIIRPLRMLNNKMREIISAGIDIELINDEETSKELTDLYDVFKNLISAKKFENNDFMFKSDALAVIDLAEACNMFDCQNYKAAGICYNNIANIQFKNEKYAQAAENFFNAIDQALICLRKKTPSEVYLRQNRTIAKELLLPEEPSRNQKVYYQKVLAHRTYQYAICLYKELRYNNGDQNDPSLTWNKVDAWLRQAIERYQGIKWSNSSQPLFIDLIIKITISRSFANIHNNKLLTAEKLLECALIMINFIEKRRLYIIEEEREEAPVIPIQILRQKYLMHSGLLYLALNREKMASKLFTECLRSGEIYDPRIRKECVIQLRNIFERHNQYSLSLEKMMLSFEHKNKDVVFLVNVEHSMSIHSDTFQKHMDYIFEKGLEQRDRISLITCSKNCRRLFSLVNKEKNFIQLRNLISRIETNQNSVPNLQKSIKEAVKEFLDQDMETFSDRNKLIILMTNSVQAEELNNDSSDVEFLLKEFECTLLVFAYGINNREKKFFKQLCNSTQESRLLIDPDMTKIEELFVELANYKFDINKTFILETFN
eukprot:403350315